MSNRHHGTGKFCSNSKSKPHSLSSKATYPHGSDHEVHSYNNTSSESAPAGPGERELRDAIHHLVEQITKTFIMDSWYQVISSTNHDFVASCESLIEEVFNKFADLCATRLDKYRTGQLVTHLLHDHIVNKNSTEKHKSIEEQIDNHEYDIVQSLVVKLFGLLSNDKLQRVVFTMINDAKTSRHPQSGGTCETSALYTLVIALLTKSVVMPIVDIISEPKWLYAVIIYLCKKEAKREQQAVNSVNKVLQQDPRQMPRNLASTTSIIVTDTAGHREDPLEVASANINFDNPIAGSLKKPLDNIEIIATEEVNSRSSSYVLYCIRFDSIYYRHPSAAGPSCIPESHEVPIIDKRQTHSVRRRANHTSAASNSSNNMTTTTTTTMIEPPVGEVPNRRAFKRSMVVKRRFREFVLLQLRLEENPKLKPYLKNIPKPTKLKSATQNIFSLPGLNNIKLDQSTIKLRQRFLERFLIALSDSPFIVNSYEFKEFLSCNDTNSSQQLSRSKSTILQVNLNKVFVDSVRSAFSILRSTLPGDDHQSLRTNTNADPDAWLTELQRSTMKLHVKTKVSHGKMGLERLIDSKLSSIQNGASPTRAKKSYGSLDRQHNNHTQNQHHKRADPPRAFDWANSNRGGSLNTHMVKSASSYSTSSTVAKVASKSSSSYDQIIDATTTATTSTRTTTTTSTTTRTTSQSSSTQSVYEDASNIIEEEEGDDGVGHDSSLMWKSSQTGNQNDCNSIQICDNYPIACKFFDIIYHSISSNPSCHKPFNLMARFFLGRLVERYAAQLLVGLVNLETAAVCVEGITASIWDESDADVPLDVEGATLELAVEHACCLIERTYASYTLIPKQLLRSLLSKQLHFYISQLGSQKRNKFVIYEFFVHLIEDIDDSSSSSSTVAAAAAAPTH